MKAIFIAMLALVSSVSYAGSFKCTGSGYNVRVFNQQQPDAGIENPGVLIFAYDERGTIARVPGSTLTKNFTEKAYDYSTTTEIHDGSPKTAFIELYVNKQPSPSGRHDGHISVTTKKYHYVVDLECDHRLVTE